MARPSATFCHWPPEISTPCSRLAPSGVANPSRQLLDEGPGGGSVEGVEDVLAVVDAVEIAGAHRFPQHELEVGVVLERRGGAAAPGPQVEERERGAVDVDGPAGGLVHAGEELDEGGLAGAVVADDAEDRAGGDVQPDVGEDVAVGPGIAERQAVERDAVGEDGGRRRGRSGRSGGRGRGNRGVVAEPEVLVDEEQAPGGEAERVDELGEVLLDQPGEDDREDDVARGCVTADAAPDDDGDRPGVGEREDRAREGHARRRGRLGPAHGRIGGGPSFGLASKELRLDLERADLGGPVGRGGHGQVLVGDPARLGGRLERSILANPSGAGGPHVDAGDHREQEQQRVDADQDRRQERRLRERQHDPAGDPHPAEPERAGLEAELLQAVEVLRVFQVLDTRGLGGHPDEVPLEVRGDGVDERHPVVRHGPLDHERQRRTGPGDDGVDHQAGVVAARQVVDEEPQEQRADHREDAQAGGHRQAGEEDGRIGSVGAAHERRGTPPPAGHGSTTDAPPAAGASSWYAADWSPNSRA